MTGRLRNMLSLGVAVSTIALIWTIFSPNAPISHVAAAASTSTSGDWTTYMFNSGRQGFNRSETVINPNTVPNLKLKWTHTTSGSIFSQPIVSSGVVYWGSSADGFEHATDLNNNKVWSDYLGVTQSPCRGGITGVDDTATVTSVTINGTPTSVDFVAGGDANMYALNAATGAVIWHTSLGSSPSHFLWSSPLVFNGNVYEGVASLDDCPLVQGQLVQLNEATGAILHTFNTVPDGCIGGGVWGSPTLDQTDNSIYFATGNQGSCSSSEHYAVAVIKVRASDLSLMSSWQVPSSEQINDGDFGSTPTLFQATIKGTSHLMVGVGNKNGIYYAFDRMALSNGPLWRARLGCSSCSNGHILSPAAWNGKTLYEATQDTMINGAYCKGGLFALNPATGTSLWQHCLADGAAYGAVTLVPGIAVIGEGPYFLAVSTATGQTLFRYLTTNSGESFNGPASISHGVLYIGGTHGNLYAFAP